MEDRKSLPFTDAVLHEIQRLLDIVPMSLPHYAIKDISFRGYIIPKVVRFHRIKCCWYYFFFLPDSKCSIWFIVACQQDTMIVPLLHSVLKEDKQWATPWSFDPQHFLDQNGNFKKNPAFLPFSAGKLPSRFPRYWSLLNVAGLWAILFSQIFVFGAKICLRSYFQTQPMQWFRIYVTY